MNPVARVRHLLARRPWIYWATVLALAGLGGWSVAAMAGDVDHARRSWGTTIDVVVATGDIDPGDDLASRTESRRLPAPMVPATAVSSVGGGSTARQHVAAGEVVVELDVAPTGGPRALIPAGWLAVAVAEAVPTEAAVGDRVAAVSGGVVLADDGVVVGHATGAVLVAVPADEAPHVAHAASSGELALLLVP